MKLWQKYKDWKHNQHIKKFGSKHIGYFHMFNAEWFEKHQPILIWLLNNWLFKYYFRFSMRIHKSCKFHEYIDKIETHTFRVLLAENKYRSEFYTHDKFSKRIYFAYRPIWWTLHFLDWLIQRTINPEFSFGFDTLTAYSQTGSGGSNTSCDGRIQGYGYYDNYQSPLGYSISTTATYEDVMVQNPEPYSYWNRLYFSFDVTIPAGSAISTRTFNFKTSIIQPSGSIIGVYLRTGSLINRNNITNNDWDRGYIVGWRALSTENVYYSFSEGDGTYMYCLSNSREGEADIPFDGIRVLMTDSTGTSEDPYVSIVYTPPASANKSQMII
jgi:hypothetical protein